jgi:quercetin dioxygenase-like cupin family protein
MRMRLLIVTTVLMLLTPAARADHHDSPTPAKPVLESLLHATLEGVDDTEVIVSRVAIPPHTTLPRHWHPGEEFAYVVGGSVTLWQEGEDDVVLNAGEVGKVPLRQVHTAITGDEGCELIVFRVHASGEPERVLVEEKR